VVAVVLLELMLVLVLLVRVGRGLQLGHVLQ
jgi:hypothetical protein